MPSESKISNTAMAGPNFWVEKYADYLYNYAGSRLDDPELCKDLLQETFLAALQGWEQFDKRSSEKTWLTAILKHKIYDVYRKRKASLNKLPIVSVTGGEADDFFDTESGHWREGHYPAAFAIEQTTSLEKKEFQGVLKSCLNKMPPLWVSVFKMKHIDAESSEEICHNLKLTASNYWVIMHRTKVGLRDCLQKHWV
jgi:RNA polymerase sigma-70 factor (ECF subfamily)